MKHHIKNVLIFLPAFFGGALFSPQMLIILGWGFVSFSCMASAVYIWNDLHDAPQDRLHEIKRNRPIASGRVSEREAWILAVALTALSLLAAVGTGKELLGRVGLFLFLYMALNVGYSCGLKNIPIVDVMILAFGFVIRVLFGAAVSGVPISKWLCLTVMLFSLYMGFGKRRNELTLSGENTRKALRFYTYDFLDKKMQMSLALGTVFYSLWSAGITNENNVSGFMIWTLPLIISIVMRYEMVIEKNSYGDPVEVLLSDPWLIGMTAVYGALICVLVYSTKIVPGIALVV